MIQAILMQLQVCRGHVQLVMRHFWLDRVRHLVAFDSMFKITDLESIITLRVTESVRHPL